MASKGDDGGHVGSGEAASPHGALWLVVSMSTCEEHCVPCFLFGGGISRLLKDLRASSLAADDVTSRFLPKLAREGGVFSARWTCLGVISVVLKAIGKIHCGWRDGV